MLLDVDVLLLGVLYLQLLQSVLNHEVLAVNLSIFAALRAMKDLLFLELYLDIAKLLGRFLQLRYLLVSFEDGLAKNFAPFKFFYHLFVHRQGLSRLDHFTQLKLL